MSAPGRARPTTPAGDETRRRILQAATRLFDQGGYTATTIRAIAEEAQADPALVVRYYGSKQELFLQASAPALRLTEDDLATTQGLVAALVASIEAQLSRWLGLTAVPDLGNLPDADVLATLLQEVVVEPVLARLPVPGGEPQRVEAVVGLVLGALSVRRRIQGAALGELDRARLVELLVPAARALLEGGPEPG